MPEGPEVRSRADELRDLLVGKKYDEIRIVSGSYKSKDDAKHRNFRTAVASLNRVARKPGMKLQFTRVGSKGKYMYFELQLFLENPQSGSWESKGYQYIGTHFMMTGQWLTDESANVRVELRYADADVLYYVDQRDFGVLEVLTKTQLQSELDSLGPDILGKITEKQFRTQLESSKSMVGAVIKDQALVSGIGNYMRADILYLAKIAPKRKANTLTDAEWKALYKASVKVATDSYKAGGTAGYQESGTYVPLIYGRTKDKLGNAVMTEKIGGQTVYWVPKVQV
jgi:DNA-formamidopyrimidine glycosylase